MRDKKKTKGNKGDGKFPGGLAAAAARRRAFERRPPPRLGGMVGPHDTPPERCDVDPGLLLGMGVVVSMQTGLIDLGLERNLFLRGGGGGRDVPGLAMELDAPLPTSALTNEEGDDASVDTRRETEEEIVERDSKDDDAEVNNEDGDAEDVMQILLEDDKWDGTKNMTGKLVHGGTVVDGITYAAVTSRIQTPQEENAGEDSARLEKQRAIMREKDRKRGLVAPAGVATDIPKGRGGEGGYGDGVGGTAIIRRGKPSTKLALKATQVSTALLGHFDRLREGEPERKGQLLKSINGKKRKQFDVRCSPSSPSSRVSHSLA
ncbi:hypothetical protein ACHAXA_003319 [Cyclostephanos tholiformis]|uniref:Uncharacterized protein n=1 Tax=Cyclostephanos tholiformis TaxID=382380 RepID=A0ABD3SBJ9_9STRA